VSEGGRLLSSSRVGSGLSIRETSEKRDGERRRAPAFFCGSTVYVSAGPSSAASARLSQGVPGAGRSLVSRALSIVYVRTSFPAMYSTGHSLGDSRAAPSPSPLPSNNNSTFHFFFFPFFFFDLPSSLAPPLANGLPSPPDAMAAEAAAAIGSALTTINAGLTASTRWRF
jgi:hypothetical protein